MNIFFHAFIFKYLCNIKSENNRVENLFSTVNGKDCLLLSTAFRQLFFRIVGSLSAETEKGHPPTEFRAVPPQEIREILLVFQRRQLFSFAGGRPEEDLLGFFHAELFQIALCPEKTVAAELVA